LGENTKHTLQCSDDVIKMQTALDEAGHTRSDARSGSAAHTSDAFDACDTRSCWGPPSLLHTFAWWPWRYYLVMVIQIPTETALASTA